jgi:hypothetical protein
MPPELGENGMWIVCFVTDVSDAGAVALVLGPRAGPKWPDGDHVAAELLECNRTGRWFMLQAAEREVAEHLAWALARALPWHRRVSIERLVAGGWRLQ